MINANESHSHFWRIKIETVKKEYCGLSGTLSALVYGLWPFDVGTAVGLSGCDVVLPYVYHDAEHYTGC